ncbi:hypothetical protein KIW84_045712 [Lathyrus oleraceus]|uniref:Uncharacterized protein n=1 Tax=Pisum sativum TaxID=3888 RepID=A0A9D4XNX4_PEA|nr:hypothetical protein KIW84_045712 [Pisum sativum]
MIPKSPLPGFVDFHGKRKQIVKIQALEREINLLQEELKSLEVFHGYAVPANAIFIRKLQEVVVHAVHHQTSNVLAAVA